jgi:hypothetical protein
VGGAGEALVGLGLARVTDRIVANAEAVRDT